MKYLVIILITAGLLFWVSGCGKLPLPPSSDIGHTVIAEISTRGRAQDAFPFEDILYVADGQAGVTTIDISDPEEPLFMANLDYLEQDDARAVYADSVLGLYMGEETLKPVLFLADWRSNFPMIMLLLDHNGLPQFEPSTFWANRCEEIDVVHRNDSLLLLIADNDDGLIIASPTFEVTEAYTYIFINQIGPEVHPPSPLYGVAGNEQLAFLACGQVGVLLVDLSDLSRTAIIGEADTPGEAQKLVLKDHYCYVADGYKGLAVVDFSNPSSPQLVNSLDPGIGYAQGIAVNDHYLYLAAGSGGLYIFNIADPGQPLLIGQIVTTYAYGVTTSGDYVYLCDRDKGILVIRRDS
ncbi:hypothetical protein JW877_07420 [bacterium]|nr:hypothetical protein [bacterium]